MMVVSKKQSALQELQQIPGVGKKIAEDLWTVGIRSIADLHGRDPEELFSRLQARAGAPVARCVLYLRLSLCRLLRIARAPRARTPEMVALERLIERASPEENDEYNRSLLISTKLW
jgi:hypothetical protein